MSNSLVSIVVPCYKQGHLLEETLESVVAQSYENWECIIVNDGSPDNTEKIAKKWCRLDNRFSYLFKENGGLPAARNSGISITTGLYILALDSDDILHKDYLLKIVPELDANEDLGIISCYRYFFKKNRSAIIYEHKPSGSTYRDLMFENILMPSSLYRRTCWEEVGGYDENMNKGFEDWEFWIAITKRGWKFKIVEEFLFYYRKAEHSMLIDTLKNHRVEVMDYVFEKHKEIYMRHFENTKIYMFFLIKLYRSSELKYKFSLEYKIGKVITTPFKKIANFFKSIR